MRECPPRSSATESPRGTLNTWRTERHGAQNVAQWCSRSYRDCHAVTEYRSVVWKTSADHAVAGLSRSDREETYRYCRAREGEPACERDTGNKDHTVVLEVVPRTTTTHSGVEGLSGPCRGRVPKTEDSPQGQRNTLLYTTPTWNTRAPSANRRSRSSAVLRSGVGGAKGVRKVVKYHKVALEEERKPQTEKQLSAEVLHC